MRRPYRLQWPSPQEEESLTWLGSLKQSWGDLIKGSPRDVVYRLLPGLEWMAKYDWRSSLLADVVAGTTVGVMAVPQCVSFASMAGLPAAYGLYGCFAPVLAYALFGSSRHLAVGPVALVSLLLNDGLTPLIPNAEANLNPNRPEDPAAQLAYNQAAIQVSIITALMYFVLSSARLGFLCNLLSRPIISGFLTAGTILISLSQVKYILGYSVPRDSQLVPLLVALWKGLPGLRWPELLMGISWLLLLHCIRIAPTWHRSLRHVGPLGSITVAALSITLVWAGDLQQHTGIQTVGVIQPGLPPFTAGQWLPLVDWRGQMFLAAVIVMVGILEAISIGKALGERHGDHIDSDRELLGLAMANLAGAAFSGYPSTGSFARSAVASDAGGQTGFCGLVTAGVVGLTMLALTPLFEHMPMNALAAIVIMGVIRLLDFQRPVFYWRVSKYDFVIWVATFLCCLFISIAVGLGVGLLLALIFLFTEMAYPTVAALGRMPETELYLDLAAHQLLSSGSTRQLPGAVDNRKDPEAWNEGLVCTSEGCELSPSLLADHRQAQHLTQPPGNTHREGLGPRPGKYPVAKADYSAHADTEVSSSGRHAAGEEGRGLLASRRGDSRAPSLSVDDLYPAGLEEIHPANGHEDVHPANGHGPAGHNGHDRESLWIEEDGWEAEDMPGLLIVAPNSPLCFANVQRVHDHIRALEAAAVVRWDRLRDLDLEAGRSDLEAGKSHLEAGRSPGRGEELTVLTGGDLDQVAEGYQEVGNSLELVVMDLSHAGFTDATAVEALTEWAKDWRSRGISLALAAPCEKVLMVLELAGFLEIIGEDMLFASVHDAVLFYLQLHSSTSL